MIHIPLKPSKKKSKYAQFLQIDQNTTKIFKWPKYILKGWVQVTPDATLSNVTLLNIF